MLLLPTFNAILQPCTIGSAALTPHAQGLFCQSCQRVVQDFRHSAQPALALAEARLASPDGRVCGMLNPGQVRVALPRRLRWFLVALVLVVGQGLTAREAMAQVRRPLPEHLRQAARPEREGSSQPPVSDASNKKEQSTVFLGMMVETMPSFRGGDLHSLVAYIQQHITWPKGAAMVCAEGQVFASFTVEADGRVRNARIVKGIHPILDGEVLRVLQGLTGFRAGLQNGKPVAVSMTVPVTFKLQ